MSPFMNRIIKNISIKNNINTEDDFISGVGKNYHYSRRTPDNIDIKIHNTQLTFDFNKQTHTYNYLF